MLTSVAVLPLLLPTLAPVPPPLVRVDAGDDQYNFVVGLFDKGLYELVVDEGRKFLDQHRGHPKTALAQYRVGLALFELERFAQAEPHLARLANQSDFEYRGECALRLGQCKLTREDYPSAADAFQIVLDAGQAYLMEPGHYLLAEAQLQQGEYKRAESNYEAALQAVSSAESDSAGSYRPDALRGLVWCAFRDARYADAVQRARAALGETPSAEIAHELHFLLAESQFESGDVQAALSSYARAGSGPFADAVLRGRGFALAALERPADAAGAFAELLQKFPESPHVSDAALHGGIQLFECGRLDEAKRALAHPALRQNADAAYWLARISADAGDIDAALKTLTAALASAPSVELKSEIHSLRGDLLTRAGRAEEATRAYREAGSDYALHAAAVAALNAGEADAAVRLARQFLETHPKSEYLEPTRMALAEALFSREAYADARPLFAALQQSAATDADRARAASRLAWCSYLQADTPDAAAQAGAEFDAVANSFPQASEAAEAAFMAGQAYVAAGRSDAAVASWKRYLSEHPAGAQVDQALLGLGRLQSGDESITTFERLLRAVPDSPLTVDARLELAERLSGGERAAQAEDHYRTVVREHGTHPAAAAALYGWAWCRFEAEDFPAALSKLEALEQRSDADPELRLAGLELMIWSRCRTDAVRAAANDFQRFAQACSDAPRVLATARVVSDALIAAGDPAQAEVVLGQLRSSNDAGVANAALIESVYVALERGAVDDAEKRARRAQANAADSPLVAEALFFVGEARFDAGDMPAARALYEAALRVPGCPLADRALYKAGFASLREEDWKTAAARFGALIDGHPTSELRGETLYLLGESLYQVGEYANAVERLELLFKTAPKHESVPKALFRQGLALAQLEEFARASEKLGLLAQRFPDFENGPEGELWRGRSLAALKKARPARQAFERVVERAPGVLAAQARLGIGRLELNAGNTEGALAEFLKVAVLYASEEEVAQALLEAGGCLETLGDPERAGSQYREILERHPNASAASAARERLSKLAGE